MNILKTFVKLHGDTVPTEHFIIVMKCLYFVYRLKIFCVSTQNALRFSCIFNIFISVHSRNYIYVFKYIVIQYVTIGPN